MYPPACASCVYVDKNGGSRPRYWFCSKTAETREYHDVLTGETWTATTKNYCDWERDPQYPRRVIGSGNGVPLCGHAGGNFTSQIMDAKTVVPKRPALPAPASEKPPVKNLLRYLILLSIIILVVFTWLAAKPANSAPPEMQEAYDKALHRMTPNGPFTTVIRVDGKRIDRVFRGCFVNVDETVHETMVLLCEYGP
jgi:hypothetical protein